MRSSDFLHPSPVIVGGSGIRIRRWVLVASLFLCAFDSAAASQEAEGSITVPIPEAVKLFKAAKLPEERAAAVARLELIGDTDSEAWNQLGLLYLNGTPSDPKLAEKMFTRAVGAKNLNGLMNLIAVRVDDGRIAEACKTAETGSLWPNGEGAPATAHLGNCYRRGEYGPKDKAKAERLFILACKWSWLPACDSALTTLREDPTPARRKAYRVYLEKLSSASYPPAMTFLAEDLLNSPVDADRTSATVLLEKASAAKYGSACVMLAQVLWGGDGDLSALPRIESLLKCGHNDNRSREVASLFEGIFAGLRGEQGTARVLFEQSYAEGMKQAGAFMAAFGLGVPSGADPAYCEHFCDYLNVIKEVRRIQQLELDERNRQAEIERVAQVMAAQDMAAQNAQQADYNAQIEAQNAEARRERRSRFFSGVFTIALALATGYVQAQADTLSSAPRPRPVYQPPAIYAPARPVTQAPAIYGSTPNSTAGLTKICYITTARGTQAITINGALPCPLTTSGAQIGTAASSSTSTGFLTGESSSGLSKICLYEGPRGRGALNVPVSRVCPVSHQY